MFTWTLLKIFNDQKLRKVVRNVSSDITWYKIRIMIIAVCKYVINQCCWFFCDPCGKGYLWKLFERIFSGNWFTLVFCMNLMRFRLKSPVLRFQFFRAVYLKILLRFIWEVLGDIDQSPSSRWFSWSLFNVETW